MPLVMETDSVGVLKNGVTLGIETYRQFRETLGWDASGPDKIISHQVGATHQKNILAAVGISAEKDFTTFPYLGNIGTVSLPITAAIAAERDFFSPGDRVGFLGIGSGLNCMMLGVEW
jgi:3-oxoacyl-[acyl-carrier-protein] synthase-3